MSNNSINFTINLNGNAYKGVLQLNDAISKVTSGIKDTNTFFERISTKAFHFDTITDAIGKLSDGFKFLAGDSLKFEQTQLNLQTLLGGSAEILRKRPTWKTFYAIMFVIYFFTILTKNRKDRKNYV